MQLDPTTQRLVGLLDEACPDLVAAVVRSLCDDDVGNRIVALRRDLASHACEAVRVAVAQHLRADSSGSPAASALIGLMADEATDVRDWATFSLGTQSDADSPDIRAALAERLADDDEETRLEAMVGLARRQDRRALPMVLAELESDEVANSAIEAAGALALPELVAPLQAVQ
ncbi:MAG: HEAT repeat domain-containing protein [Hyphomicrobiaceae bacterium]